MLRALLTAAAIIAAMLIGAGLLSLVSSGQPYQQEIVLRAATSSTYTARQKTAATFVRRCIVRPTASCETSKWDNDVTIVISATRRHAAVAKWCPRGIRYGAWRIGFCRGQQDDSTRARLAKSTKGVYARASLVR
jgi:hypothetical protein